jgi:FkbM family methyltransferase
MLKHTIRRVLQVVAPRLLLAVLGRRTWVHEAELAFVARFAVPDGLAVDVGANKGVYLHKMSKHFATVHAYEPQPSLSAFLKRAAPRNVTVHAAAVSDHRGVARLGIPVAANLNELATIDHPETLPGEVRFVDVPSIRLDDEGLPRLDFMKIDVEGHELAVLNGARGLIEAFRPVVLIEAEERHHAGAVAGVAAFFVGLDYVGYVSDAGELRPIETFDAARDQNVSALSAAGARQGRYLNNFVFLPAERVALR